MIYLQNINIPIMIEYVNLGTVDLSATCKSYKLSFSKAIILTGKKYSFYYARQLQINNPMIAEIVHNVNNTKRQIETLRTKLLDSNFDLIIAVGGGRVLDTVKSLAFLSNVNYLAIPTQISTDALASPISILKDKGKEKAYTAQIPMGILIDLNIIVNSDPIHIINGIGDLLSNEVALIDWQLAINKNKASPNPFAKILSKLSYRSLDFSEPLNSDIFIKTYVESVMLAGQSMSLSGSSRPCSGSEHLLAHALDQLGCQKPHGFLVGSTTPFCLFLHQRLSRNPFFTFLKSNFAIDFVQYLISPQEIDFLFDLAKNIRGDRYTILNEFSNEELKIKYQEFQKTLIKYNL